MIPLFRVQFQVEIKTAGIDSALTILRKKKQERVVFKLGLVDHRKKARLSGGGAISGYAGDGLVLRTDRGGRENGLSLPRLPGNEACQPDDERQGRKPDG